MRDIDPGEVKQFIVGFFSDALQVAGIDPDELPDDMDLLQTGVIDSMGILEITIALEERFEVPIDLEELPADQLVAVGPLASFVANQLGEASR